MRIAKLGFSIHGAIAAAMLVACVPPDDKPTARDGGDAGDASGTDAAGGDASGDAGDTGGQTAPTYTKDVQPIFKMKCAPCHDGQSMGKHDIASSYADVQKPIPKEAFDAQGCWNDVEMTMPKTIGECAVISVKRGWMPLSKGCFAAMPPDPSVCLSAEQIAILEKWLAAGMPE